MESLTKAQQELYDWLVEYIQSTQHAPSIRQMMRAMNLKSPAPIQSRLERLRNKGYIDWTEGQARTLRILQQEPPGVKVLGAIAAGGLVEPYTDQPEILDLQDMFDSSRCYGLRVMGDSMVDDFIAEGDIAIMQRIDTSAAAKEGDIVAARVEGHGNTLKRLYREGSTVILKPSNPRYEPIEAEAEQVEIQGVLVGIWRGFRGGRFGL